MAAHITSLRWLLPTPKMNAPDWAGILAGSDLSLIGGWKWSSARADVQSISGIMSSLSAYLYLSEQVARSHSLPQEVIDEINLNRCRGLLTQAFVWQSLGQPQLATVTLTNAIVQLADCGEAARELLTDFQLECTKFVLMNIEPAKLGSLFDVLADELENNPQCEDVIDLLRIIGEGSENWGTGPVLVRLLDLSASSDLHIQCAAFRILSCAYHDLGFPNEEFESLRSWKNAFVRAFGSTSAVEGLQTVAQEELAKDVREALKGYGRLLVAARQMAEYEKFQKELRTWGEVEVLQALPEPSPEIDLSVSVLPSQRQFDDETLDRGIYDLMVSQRARKLCVVLWDTTAKVKRYESDPELDICSFLFSQFQTGRDGWTAMSPALSTDHGMSLVLSRHEVSGVESHVAVQWATEARGISLQILPAVCFSGGVLPHAEVETIRNLIKERSRHPGQAVVDAENIVNRSLGGISPAKASRRRIRGS